MQRIQILIFFFCLIFVPVSGCDNLSYGGQQSPLINEVRNSINRIKPFKVRFVQQVFDEDQLEIEESGEIIFKDHQQLKWTYLDPDYKVFILEGGNYKFYDQENEQLTIGEVKDKGQQWIWQLLFSEKAADHIKADEKNRKVHIKNDAEALDLEVLVDNRFLPVKAVQNDPSGARLVYYFKDYKEKIKISSDLFQLKVPEGVEVIVD